jgi:hypothetical protein
LRNALCFTMHALKGFLHQPQSIPYTYIGYNPYPYSTH